MLARNISCIPVLDGDRRIVDLLFWESVFHEGRQPTRPEAIDVPVVIMAAARVPGWIHSRACCPSR